VGSNGGQLVRFQTVSALATPEFMERLIALFNQALDQGKAGPLLFIASFVFDFECIHPFWHGNGRSGTTGSNPMKKFAIICLAPFVTLFFLTAGVLAGEKIKIGAIFSVTGGQASIDTPGLKGAQLAAKEIELIHLDGKTRILRSRMPWQDWSMSTRLLQLSV
jgi:hypothetical protein